MIHLVTSTNRHLYDYQLEQFRARCGRGDDCHDDDDVVHLVGVDAGGDLAAGVRLRPTLQRSIIADRLPDLAATDRARLHRVSTLEASRLILTCHGSHDDRRARAELGVAMLEAAQLLGASRIVGIVHLAQWPMLDSSGWRITPLGTPMPDRRGNRIAFEIGVSPDDLQAMRDAWAIERALIYLDDQATGRLPIKLVGRHADELARLADAGGSGRLVGRQLVEAPVRWSPGAARDADRGTMEEVLQILDAIIDQEMLQRPDSDVRQQGAIMLLSVARSRLRMHLAMADAPPSLAELVTPMSRSTH